MESSTFTGYFFNDLKIKAIFGTIQKNTGEMETEKLNADTAYEIGKFRILLTENGDLKIIGTSTRDRIRVLPESSNSIIINSSR